MRTGGGPGQARGEKLEGLIDELDLSEEQRSRVENAFQEMREALQALRSQFSPGQGDREELMGKVKEIRDQFDEELKEAVNSLGPEYRSVILLWSLEELSYREIAEVCDCPIGTVMSRLYRARQQLGQRLADYAVENKIATERFSR